MHGTDMKKIVWQIAGLMAIMLLLAACSGEKNEFEPTPVHTRALTIDLSTGTAVEGNKEPIRSVRFIVFDDISSAAPKLDVNRLEPVDGTEKTTFTANLLVTENADKLIVAIVNEPGTMKDKLDQINHPTILQHLPFTLSDALNNGGNPVTTEHKGLPMIGTMGLSISGDELSDLPSGALKKGPIIVYRILARVDVYLKNQTNSKPGSVVGSASTAELIHSSKKGYLVRTSYKNHSGEPVAFGRWMRTTDSEYVEETNLSWIASVGETVDNTLNNGAGLYLCSFYIPEWEYNATASDALGIRISGIKDYSGQNRDGVMYLTKRPDNTNPMTAIERNNVYKITGIIPQSELPEVPIIFGGITVAPWGPVTDINIDNPIN